MSCGFTGNSDVYGLGIRIGYYTQAIAVWFSNFFLLEEAKSLRANNNLFLFALIIAGSIYSLGARQTYAVEAFLLLQVGLCITFVSILESTRYSTRYMKLSHERIIMRSLVFNVFLIFNISFWWCGLNVMLPTPCEGSEVGDQESRGTYAFYIVPANIYGWMRTLMKILSLFHFLWRTLRTTFQDLGKTVQNLRMKETRATFIRIASVISLSDLLTSILESPDNTRVKNPNLHGLGSKASKKSQLPPSRVSNNTNEGSKISSKAPSLQLQNQNHQQASSSQDPSLGIRPVVSPKTQQSSISQLPQSRPSEEFSFDNVYNAEQYLTSVLSIYTDTKTPAQRKYLATFFGGHVRFFMPTYKTRSNPQTPSYTYCLYSTLLATWTNKPPFALRAALSQHISALQQHSNVRWPRLVNRMIELQRTSPPPPWRLLCLASDIRLSQIPLTISARLWAFMAAETFLIIVALIVQVELTIVWNHMQGVQTLDTLGQLIACIIGVGGLVQVLWKKWKQVRSGEDEGGRPTGGEHEAAIEIYIKWRNIRENQGVVNPSVAP